MNKLITTILITFSILSHASEIDSLNTEQNNYFKIGINTKSYHFLDQQTSALQYSGMLGGLQLAYELENDKRKYGFGIFGDLGFVSSKTQSAEYSALQGVFGLDGYYSHRVATLFNSIKAYAGLSIQHVGLTHYNTGLQNAGFTLSLINHLDLNINLDRTFSWKAKDLKLWFIKFKRRDRKLKACFNFKLPVIFENYRAPYATISDFSDGENLFNLENASFVAFNKAIMFETTSSITYYLSNSNALRFSYQWQAFRFKDQFFTYQAAYHAFSFALLIKLN
jgi:hypothetical protein